MFQKLFIKKLLASKMKDVPQEQQEQVLAMFEKNPELFATIGKEVQEEMKKGKDQMTAVMEVMRRYEGELKGLSK